MDAVEELKRQLAAELVRAIDGWTPGLLIYRISKRSTAQATGTCRPERQAMAIPACALFMPELAMLARTTGALAQQVERY